MKGGKRQRTNALIRLMDDPDTLIFEAIQEELLKEDAAIIPELEKSGKPPGMRSARSGSKI